MTAAVLLVAAIDGKAAGDRRPAHVIRAGFALAAVGLLAIVPLVPRIDSGWWLALPLVAVGAAWACSCRSSTTTRSHRSTRNG